MFEDLNDPEFTSELVRGAVESGVPIHVAVGDIVRGIGVKEFAQRIGMASSNVVRATRPSSNPRMTTLGRMLRPLGLLVSVAYCDPKTGAPLPRRRRGRMRPM